MKNASIYHYLASLLLMMSIASCKPSQMPTDSSAYGQEIEEAPCTQASDAKFRRASASGDSPDREYSIDLARQAARDRLAQDVKTKVINVMKKYREQVKINGEVAGFGQVNQDASLQVVNEVLEDLNVYCSRTFQKNTGLYTTFVGYEMPKESLKNGLDSYLQTEANKNGIAYRKDQFSNHFDEEFSQP